MDQKPTEKEQTMQGWQYEASSDRETLIRDYVEQRKAVNRRDIYTLSMDVSYNLSGGTEV